MQSDEYIDLLILEIAHTSCKEPTCTKSSPETNFLLNYGRFSEWVVVFVVAIFLVSAATSISC